MSSISFLKGTIVAFVLSIVASVTYLSAITIVGGELAIHLTISVAAFAYILVLLNGASASFGRISFISLYIICTGLLSYVQPSVVAYALFHVSFIWLVRTVYYHSNGLYAVADLFFSLISFSAAIGAIIQSQNVFISFWSFFLAQAFILPLLHFVFKKQFSTTTPLASHRAGGNDQNTDIHHAFELAHRTAEEALNKLGGKASCKT